MLFAYPESALANRNVAKSRIYQHQTVKADIKNLFTTQVEKITWLYKLSDSTLNVTASSYLSYKCFKYSSSKAASTNAC